MHPRPLSPLALALTLFLAPVPVVHAQELATPGPAQVLQTTIAGVMAAIRDDPGARAGDPDRTYRVVERRFLPATDFMLSTEYAVGPAWTRASAAQRAELFRQFQTLLARTYALQLTQLQGEDTRFSYAPAPPLVPDARDAIVRTTVVSGGDSMAIGYRLHRTAAGWKIYDIDMMGAWMIQVYRQQFAARLAAGGIDGLISYLAAHNRGT